MLVKESRKNAKHDVEAKLQLLSFIQRQYRCTTSIWAFSSFFELMQAQKANFGEALGRVNTLPQTV